MYIFKPKQLHIITANRYYNAFGNLCDKNDTKLCFTRTFNRNNKQISVYQHGKNWWHEEYDEFGRSTYFICFSGFWVKYEYDQFGNIMKHIDSDGDGFEIPNVK